MGPGDMANETTADKKALDLTEGMTTVEGLRPTRNSFSPGILRAP